VHALPYGLERKNGTATFALEQIGDVRALERLWRTLDRSGAHSFFASWTWASAILQRACGDVRVLKAMRGGALAGIALLTLRRGWHRRAWFNASGDRALDGVMIEHNGFALAGAEDEALWSDFVAWFAAGGLGVDELVVPGTAARGAVPDDIIAVEDCRKAFRTPLVGLGPEGIAPHLSRNARQQLRRSLRDFGGEVRVDVAPDTATAQEWFSGLKALHIRSWTRRGRAHAFDNGAFEPFHRTLIDTAGDSVNLMRITADDQVLGYLYNFKRNGVVHSYQSGLADDDPALRPGYVCHALAIGHYARAGMTMYDFLAGTNRLKQSFGRETYEMCWRRYRRPTLRFRLERTLRARFAS
jgi:CelD/BcsL family acetyltransferase involved in cellulose biosynthesis